MKTCLLIICTYILTFSLFTETAKERPYASHLIGTNLETVIRTLGYPESFYSVRGDAEWQDDIAFLYKEGGLRLFFFDSHVWQIGISRENTSLGIHDLVSWDDPYETMLDYPFFVEEKTEDYLVFYAKDRGFPVFVKVFFQDGMAEEIYLFRADL